MTNYKSHNESQPFKWLVALMVFMLTMGLTFSNVYGLTVPPPKGGDAGGNYDKPDKNLDDGSSQPPRPVEDPGNNGDNDNPDAVPEPGTIILLAVGLGAAYTSMRKKM